MDDKGPSVLFKRSVHPSFEPLNHVTKLGIKLRSTSQRPCTPRSPRMVSAKSNLSNRAKSSTSRFIPQTSNVKHVFNMVVPINAPDDDYNVRTSSTAHSFSAERSRNQSGTLPHMIKSVYASPRLTSAKSTKTHVTFLGEVSPNTSEAHILPNQARWRNKEQPRRYQQERENLTLSRHKNKSSQVRPHRVDRMYYMAGTGLNMSNKYQVDENEFQRLREMASQRKSYSHYGRGLSRYKYFELPTETHLPDTFNATQWRTSNTPYSDEDTSPHQIDIPTSEELYSVHQYEEQNTFSPINPNMQGENVKNSARNVDLTKEMMHNLQLDCGDNSSTDSYIPYHLSLAENDGYYDEISVVAAENNFYPDHDESGREENKTHSHQIKGDRLAQFLHQQLCFKHNHTSGETIAENKNNNARSNDTMVQFEDGAEISHYDCTLQTSRRNVLSSTPCPHKKRELQCSRCGYRKPSLNVRDVKFSSWVAPPQRFVVVTDESKKKGATSGALFRCSSKPVEKRESRHTSDRDQCRIGSSDVIKLVYRENQKATTLPNITRSFYMKTPRKKDIVGENNSKSSDDELVLPKVDQKSPSEKNHNMQPEHRETAIHSKASKAQEQSVQIKKGTFVRNDQSSSIVKMQVLPPEYKNSLNGSFIPHSLLKARVPASKGRQRMDITKSKECKVPNPQRIMVEIQLSTPTGVRVYRKQNYTS